MANSSAKRIASQNEAAIRTIKLGMLICSPLSLLLRFILRRSAFPPSMGSLIIYALASLPATFLARYLQNTGSPRRDALTGALISPGEDLGQPGATQLCFDVLYVTWACQLGSGALGEWFWWLYSVIPLYAIFKLWTSLIYPMLFASRSASGAVDGSAEGEEAASKRQEKLRKRNERGDARVKVQSRR